jgi:putative hemolysin
MTVLLAITGEFRDGSDPEEQKVVLREDGSTLLVGWMPVGEFADRLDIAMDDDRDYETVTSFILDVTTRLPEVVMSLVHAGSSIEVMDLDCRRIDKVLMQKMPEA